MYFCGDCKKQFQGGYRIDGISLWKSYLTEKRTVKELSVMHKCSEWTIRRKINLVIDSFSPSYPKEATVIIDTTYFSGTFNVMLFQDATSGKILYRKIVRNYCCPVKINWKLCISLSIGIAAVLIILGLGFQFQTVSIIKCTYFDKKRPIITDNSKK